MKAGGSSSGSVPVDHYRHMGWQGINEYGLTDAILARTDMKAERPGHKRGLIRLAHELGDAQAPASQPAPELYRVAVMAGRAPRWIVQNLEAIEVIERKICNRHDFFENLELAFRFPRIDPERSK